MEIDEDGADGNGEDDVSHVIMIPNLTVPELLDLRLHPMIHLGSTGPQYALGLVLVQGSWSSSSGQKNNNNKIGHLLSQWIHRATKGLVPCQVFAAQLEICEETDPEGFEAFVNSTSPSQLPALAVAVQGSDMDTSRIHYLQNTSSSKLQQLLLLRKQQQFEHYQTHEHPLVSSIFKDVCTTIYTIEDELSLPLSPQSCQDALRIFVAGDRSSVGKSSICLGILGSLLNLGYHPEHLAYIKPATQSEAPQQPIQLFCQRHGIRCVPIGPLVYYRGFTRAFLAGETEPTSEWLLKCGQAVDRVARNKAVVLVDGVGFPAVGSICGTDNATVSKACGYPIVDYRHVKSSLQIIHNRHPMGVVVVGGSGVGAAVDGFNLNAAYFERAHVPVLGAIFNKLSTNGFYSLEQCREQVTRYFELQTQQQQQQQQQQTASSFHHNPQPFGFVPLFSEIAGPNPPRDHDVDRFIDVFQMHVNVAGIIQAATNLKNAHNPGVSSVPPLKRFKRPGSETSHPPVTQRVVRSRADIETNAIEAGAAPSA